MVPELKKEIVDFITLVYPYYDNRDMFIHQQEQWNAYPPEVLNKIEIIVTDDCSPNKPALKAVLPKRKRKFRLQLYRISENVRWNWIAAKNIGAHHARKNSWLFLTDIDHHVPGLVLGILLDNKFNRGVYYTFDRRDAPHLTPYKHHPNTFFMHRELFWKLGGYDETFSGYYGTDGYYRKRLDRVAIGWERLKGLYVIRYPREVIPDASTTEFERKTEFDKSKKPLMNARLEANSPMKALSFPYEKLI